jgi:hypothetical protein
MPTKKDPAKKNEVLPDGTVKEYKSYKSQREFTRGYLKEFDSKAVRFPKGWLAKMDEYVKSKDKYNSVNDMICQLVRKEIKGIDK